MEGVIGRFGTALGGVVVALGLVLAAQAQEAKKEAPKDLVLKGDAKCTRCHDAEDEYPVLAIAKTRHGVNADQRTPTCTSCHGESENHINKPADAKERPKPDRVFKRNNDTTPPNVQVAACLTCHAGRQPHSLPGQRPRALATHVRVVPHRPCGEGPGPGEADTGRRVLHLPQGKAARRSSASRPTRCAPAG